MRRESIRLIHKKVTKEKYPSITLKMNADNQHPPGGQCVTWEELLKVAVVRSTRRAGISGWILGF
ncbi:hypothetical protein AIN02nite_22780 [Acetobacter indonesiensis]|uniref:Uncharacterized protein n=1 Tax=Acetobacter indonesiensis TaxID=104101 RepID=A0A6N3T5W7_9PROT|nr:hypothetical protein Abin_040_023 [Acetobacter indonesiensis]GEN04253.1 hypothetical protein AIN02nite_22780 [Acetobacter indonesiensis]